MYKKAEYHKIKSRLEEQRRFIQVIMGARQIGKSTVVKQVLKDVTIPYQFFLPTMCRLQTEHGFPIVGRQPEV